MLNVIATTKGSGLKVTLKYLERVVVQWGGFNTGKMGRDIRTIDNKIKEYNKKQYEELEREKTRQIHRNKK